MGMTKQQIEVSPDCKGYHRQGLQPICVGGILNCPLLRQEFRDEQKTIIVLVCFDPTKSIREI